MGGSSERNMRKAIIALLALVLVVAVSCDKRERVRAVYYWQTTLRLDSSERAFLKELNINKVYCRYFDVVTGDNGLPRPNATLAFDDSFPQGVEVVPVVYVLNGCMKTSDSSLASLILERVLKMNEVNGVRNVRELQIDCDWTQSTQLEFFRFMERLRKLCHDRGMTLSTTIRLHQLSQQAPPADHGVLMVYNTGDVTKLSVSKPILDVKDVAPYLRYLGSYRLGLSAAYPLFTWRVLFRGGRYVGIMHGDDDLPVLPGDSIAIRQPEIDDILKAGQAVGKARRDANDEIILYDLSNKNINRFNLNDYESFYDIH